VANPAPDAGAHGTMAFGTTVFNAEWNTLTEARVSLRVGRNDIAKALCGAFDTTRTATEEGIVDTFAASVKILKADWPLKDRPEGKVVELLLSGDTKWKSCRVVGVSETDGVWSLNVVAEFA